MSSTKQNKSYFLQYFLYKIKTPRTIILYALLNFLAVLLPIVATYGTFVKMSKNVPQNSVNYFSTPYFQFETNAEYAYNYSFFIVRIVVVITFILFTVTTVKSFKYYHNRAAMDTLGCLPLSYGDRFWGDYLSGLAVNMVSFVPFGIISYALTFSLEAIFEKIDRYGYLQSVFPRLVRSLVITLFIEYMAIHAITAFVTSCCGRFGNSVLFSFVTMLIMPGLFMGFGMEGYSNILGVDSYSEVKERVGMFPPFGAWFSDNYLITSVLNMVVSVLIIAAFIVGAYFIGRNRKSERVEQGFVVYGVYHIISLAMVAIVIVFMVFYSSNGIFDIKTILKSAGLSFLIYFAFEYSKNKSFKGFWKSLVRYGCVFVATFGILVLMRVTGGFGEQYRIPSADNVEYVEMASDYYHSDNSGHRCEFYETSDISALIEEHRKLLESSDKLYTGNNLLLTYHTKSGRTIKRNYGCIKEDDNPIKVFSENIMEFDTAKKNMLGFLADPVYDENLIVGFDEYYGEYRQFLVRSDKVEELVELLKYDIFNNYDASYDVAARRKGCVKFKNGEGFENFHCYDILATYTDTLAFLENLDNFATEVQEGKKYYIQYHNEGETRFSTTVRVSLEPDDESETVKKFIELIEPKSDMNSENGEFSEKFNISADGYFISYGIRKENEPAARKAILEIFREKTAE